MSTELQTGEFSSKDGISLVRLLALLSFVSSACCMSCEKPMECVDESSVNLDAELHVVVSVGTIFDDGGVGRNWDVEEYS